MSDVFCLMGPTASGKTALALHLASIFPFEIVSVDSALIYKEMDIGTAKPTKDELARAPHHLIDIVNPNESFSAALFLERAKPLCDEILAKSKIPLLVGGTSLYFTALQQGLAKLPEKSDSLRQELLQRAEVEGWESLHKELAILDPESASKINPQDKQRIQRALEVRALTGKPMSSFFAKTIKDDSYFYHNILLMPADRAWLHARIAERFDAMINLGFLEEVERLIKKWGLSALNPSMRTVGYRQAHEYLKGDYNYDNFHSKAIAATRQLAKRQLTWLRHWPKGYFFPCDESNTTQEIVALIHKILDNSKLNSL